MTPRITGAAGVLLALASAAPLAAQAKLATIIPADARVLVFALGGERLEPIATGHELVPGDIILVPVDSVLIELSCTVASRASTYRVRSPFRVMIDVPTDSACATNVLSGEMNVLAESPTETTAGGVVLGSTGTQYAVEVRRTARGVMRKVTVFDGQLRVLSAAARGLEVRPGSNMLWRAGAAEWSVGANGPQELDRAASVYARFDVEEAERKGAPVADRTATYGTLKAAHYAVLAAPGDTAKRVDLAKKQIEYRVNDQALYNLKRVDVVREPELRRYQIDPAALRANLRVDNRVWYDRQIRAVGAAGGAAAGAAAVAGDRDAAVAGRAQLTRARAVADSLQAVVRRYPSARDYLGLARAYETLAEKENARAAGERALALYQQSRGLSEAELREVRELIARNR
jgi:hypothetical protein